MEEWIDAAYSCWKLVQCSNNLPSLVINRKTILSGNCAVDVRFGESVYLSIKKTTDALCVSSLVSMNLSSGNRMLDCNKAPLFENRILYIPDEEITELTCASEHVRVAKIFKWCKKALLLGYNCLLISFPLLNTDSHCMLKYDMYNFIFSNTKRLGLLCGFDVSFLRHHSRVLVASFLNNLKADFIFIRDLELFFSDGFGLLYHESIVEGAIWMCSQIAKTVSIFIQIKTTISQSAFSYLCTAIPQNCFIAFDGFDSFNNPSCIWLFIQNEIVSGILPLVPIFDGGLTKYGCGLWPLIPKNYFQIEGMVRYANMCGAVSSICKTSYIPVGSTFLECSLWIMAQMMIYGFTVHELFSIWINAKQSSWDISLHICNMISHILESICMNKDKSSVSFLLKYLDRLDIHDCFVNAMVKEFIETAGAVLETGNVKLLLYPKTDCHPFSVMGVINYQSGVKQI